MVHIGDIQLNDFPLLLVLWKTSVILHSGHYAKKFGCDLLYTEFISVEGLIRDADKSVRKLDIYDEERPIGSTNIWCRAGFYDEGGILWKQQSLRFWISIMDALCRKLCAKWLEPVF